MALFELGQSATLNAIRYKLRSTFGPDRENFGLTAIEQFVRSFIGSKTYDIKSWAAFRRLHNRYSDLGMLADVPVAEIEALLEGVTHADKKARELKEAIRQIRARSGTADLDFLADLDERTAILCLEQIKGVGRKVAAAVLNFSLMRRRAFVADTHIIRVMSRFGFVRPKADAEDVYDAVMPAADELSADDLYELHWHLKKLGQRICRPMRPDCRACPLTEICMKRADASSATYAA